ncbi:hypothetical protein QE152_g38549 [Popillia japonica]|uniref:Uncharacterized protein n=1 Tax=Popillia japonica TaxID=7064 RepID=A0AAW1HWS7_POPJA
MANITGDAQNTQIPIFPEFNPQVEDLESYVERFECFTMMYSLPEDNKNFTSIRICPSDCSVPAERIFFQSLEANLDSICGREWVFPAGINLVNVNEIEAKDTGSQAIVQITNLASSYEDIFANEIGCLKDVEAELFLEKEEKPIFLKARTVPYAGLFWFHTRPSSESF